METTVKVMMLMILMVHYRTKRHRQMMKELVIQTGVYAVDVNL